MRPGDCRGTETKISVLEAKEIWSGVWCRGSTTTWTGTRTKIGGTLDNNWRPNRQMQKNHQDCDQSGIDQEVELCQDTEPALTQPGRNHAETNPEYKFRSRNRRNISKKLKDMCSQPPHRLRGSRLKHSTAPPPSLRSPTPPS